MRIDPETVYIEVNPSALILNHKTMAERHAPSLTFHWKPEPRPGTKWERIAFLGDKGQTLGALMEHVGKGIDGLGGLDPFLTEAETMRRGR